MARPYRSRLPSNDAPADPDPDPDPDPSSDSDSDNIVAAQPCKAPPRGRRRKKTAASKAAPQTKSASQTNHDRHIRDQEATGEEKQGKTFASTIARCLSAREIDEAETLETYSRAWQAMLPADSMISRLDKFIPNDIATRLDQIVASRARKCNTSDSSWRKIQTCLNKPPWNLLKIHLYAIFGEDCLARTFLPVMRELSMLTRAEDGRSLSLDEAFPVLSQKRDQRRNGMARVKGVEPEPQWQAWELKQTIRHFVQEGWVERIKAPMQGGKKKKKQQDQHEPSGQEKGKSLREHELAPLNKNGAGPDGEGEQADTETENGSAQSGDGTAEDANLCLPTRSTTANGKESEADNEKIGGATDGADDAEEVSHASQADNENVGAATDGADDDDEREIEELRRASRRLSLDELSDDNSCDMSITDVFFESSGNLGVSRASSVCSSHDSTGSNNDHFDDAPLFMTPSPAQRNSPPPPAPAPRDTRAVVHDNTTSPATAAAAAATPTLVSKSRLPLNTTSTMADDDASASRKRPRTDGFMEHLQLRGDLRAKVEAALPPTVRDELVPGLRACFDVFSVTSPSRTQPAEPTPNDDPDDSLTPCRLDAPDGSSYIAFMYGMCLGYIPPTPNPANDHPQATIYVPAPSLESERGDILDCFFSTTGITGIEEEHVHFEELGSLAERDKQILVVAAKALCAAYPNANPAQVQVQQDIVHSVWRRFIGLCRNRVASRLSSESFMEAAVTFPAMDLASTFPAGECVDSPLAARAATADIATLQKMEASLEDIEKLLRTNEEIRKIVIARLGHLEKEVIPSPSMRKQIQDIENLLTKTQDASLRNDLDKHVHRLQNAARESHDRRKSTLQGLKSALGVDKADYMDARDNHPVKIQMVKEELVEAWRAALRRVETACGLVQAEN
ncbi:uncharacterized protein MYCFIDRAFT_217107 [Pseudocercospora fijiensis CIRAD86]|uniref:Uncharacterized protein n=1 Tax=Pseudocercospora fijiensis (strain CIRAD86) TaxID=383855 RepID=M2YGQ4_PSEFD|nr:uncharacterized protein MYCFIDRAFT_217107 [Pseudocercospora fijiensis CIRAD86]EME76990.1 hypothetical protein MYCFIDRAFT_217107 [Pseudocercospora fijiensis CIRAD86]